eukprot:5739652-Pleurochrysis_carterae.AAC.1
MPRSYLKIRAYIYTHAHANADAQAPTYPQARTDARMHTCTAHMLAVACWLCSGKRVQPRLLDIRLSMPCCTSALSRRGRGVCMQRWSFLLISCKSSQKRARKFSGWGQFLRLRTHGGQIRVLDADSVSFLSPDSVSLLAPAFTVLLPKTVLRLIRTCCLTLEKFAPPGCAQRCRPYSSKPLPPQQRYRPDPPLLNP